VKTQQTGKYLACAVVGVIITCRYEYCVKVVNKSNLESITSSNVTLARDNKYQSQSHIASDGQSVRLSWCRAPSGSHDQILILS
jgi:hypothetical protein